MVFHFYLFSQKLSSQPSRLLFFQHKEIASRGRSQGSLEHREQYRAPYNLCLFMNTDSPSPVPIHLFLYAADAGEWPPKCLCVALVGKVIVLHEESGRRDWKDGSVLKSTSCSCRGFKFGSQDLHSGSQSSIVTLVPWYLMHSPGLYRY